VTDLIKRWLQKLPRHQHPEEIVTMKAFLIITATTLALCAAGPAAPSREELTALLQNPTSDWLVIFPDLNKGIAIHDGPDTAEETELNNKESAEYGTMRELADLDALAYVKAHPSPIDMVNAMDIGHAHAFKHNLIGSAAQTYCQFFGGSVNDLYKQ
jgi:hypothetical protein